MDSLLTIAPLFMLMEAFLAKEVALPATYIVKHSTSCPSEGYYFRREGAPNAVSPPPCYLCFCQGNNTAVCWLRKNNRCDTEQFHYHHVGRKTRVRRSPISLSDIFVRDSTRDFFNKQMPEQCKPFEGSFSDGCPPADWCAGCTVCDCDANGRWDCHILSFCNEGDKKNKMKSRKVPLPKSMPTRRVYHQGQPPQKKPTPKPKAKAMNPKPKRKINGKKPNKSNKKREVKTTRKPQKKHIVNNKKKHQTNKQKKRNTTRKSQQLRFVPKKKQVKRSGQNKKKTTRAPKHKNTPKMVKVTTSKSLSNTNLETLDPNKAGEETQLGRQLVRQVMAKVEQMISKQIAGIQNMTRVQRSIHNNGCYHKKKATYKKSKPKDTRRNHNEWKAYKMMMKQKKHRQKREALVPMNISFVEFEDANYLGNFTKDDLKDASLSVKRNTSIPSIPNFGISLNLTKTELIDFNNQSNSTTLRSTTIGTPWILNSTIANKVYEYSFDKNNSNSSYFTTDYYENYKSINNSIVLDLIVTAKVNLLDKEKGKQNVTIKSNPEFNTHQNFEPRLSKENKSIINIETNEVTKFKKPEIKQKPSLTTNSNKFWMKPLKEKVYANNMKKTLSSINKYGFKQVKANNFSLTLTNKSSNQSADTDTIVNKTSRFQNLLQNLMKEVRPFGTPVKDGNTKFNVFKYMKNIFRKLFSKNKSNHLNHKTNEARTLEILCEHIGACYLNKHNKIALRTKLHDLNKETEKIFKKIKNIQVLLYLIEIPINITEITTKKSRHRDIQKLDAILKGTYSTGDNHSLSEMQEAQINYVKLNIHDFIESVEKFTTILNDIIDELYKNNKKYTCQRKSRQHRKKKSSYRLNKIKNILMKYNIIQNTFMKRMYKLLTDIEKNVTTENPKPVVEKINTQAIDRYSKNIIENLRRLKTLAQVLNSSRKKRQTMKEDDAIEYLLMLIEYLLKQNHPLDTSPVNDGIDLLIEAIQNAPDIKPIKKKVLDFVPTITPQMRTTSEDKYSKDENFSDSDMQSKEDNSSSIDEHHFTIERVVDTEEETTEIVIYNKYDTTITTFDSEYETQTENENKRESQIPKNGTETESKSIFDRFESSLDDNKKYELFISESDDDAVIPLVKSTTETHVLTEDVTNKLVEETTYVPLLDFKIDESPVEDEKSKMDWIEENFGKEIRAYRENEFDNNLTTVTITTPVTVEIITIKPVEHSVDNISSVTVELEEEKNKKKSKSEDEVLYRKQIEFLNSLDYGTERSEFDDSVSKDEERYPGDSFPAYFVK